MGAPDSGRNTPRSSSQDLLKSTTSSSALAPPQTGQGNGFVMPASIATAASGKAHPGRKKTVAARGRHGPVARDGVGLESALSQSGISPVSALHQPWMKASRSALTLSFSVVHRPCGALGYTSSLAVCSSLDDSMAESAIGTIWSSSPWMTSAGTLIFFRSAVRSVSEKALTQKYEAGMPACSPCEANQRRTPSDTFEPGRL